MKNLVYLLLVSFFYYPIDSFAEDQLNNDLNVLITKRIFNELRADNTEILNEFYGKDVVFEDPVGKIVGLESMKSYYKNMYKDVTDIRFDFKESAKNKSIYFFKWSMWLSTPNLNGGEGFFVSGVSEIHFQDGFVKYHRDYFDMGEMVYERVPVLGWLTKKIKGRLKHQ